MNNNLKLCPVCNAEMAKSAKSCPHCGAKNQKPIYLRPWFILLAIVAIIVCISSINSASKNITLQVNQNGSTVNITARDLVDVGINDQARYNREFYGKTVTFTGTVTGTQGWTNHANLGRTYRSALEFDLGDGKEIVVYLQSETQFTTGETVTVTGELSTVLYSTLYISSAGSQIK